MIQSIIAIICIAIWIGVALLIIFIIVSNKKSKSKAAGNLVIIQDDDDGPYIFLEITDEQAILHNSKVELNVVRKNRSP